MLKPPPEYDILSYTNPESCPRQYFVESLLILVLAHAELSAQPTTGSTEPPRASGMLLEIS